MSLSFFEQRCSARALGYARIVIGVAAILRGFHTWRLYARLIRPDTLRAPVFALPEAGPITMSLVLATWFACAAAFTIGLRTRWAAGSLLLPMVYTLLLDYQLYSNHLYLLCLLVGLLGVANAGAALSVDAALRGEQQVLRWPIELLKLQVSIVYFFGSITKLNPAWLSGAMLMNVARREGSLVPETVLRAELMVPSAYAVVLLEMFVALGLRVPRWRKAAAASGVLLHLLLIAGIGHVLRLPIVVFALQLVILYPLFFDTRDATSPPRPTA